MEAAVGLNAGGYAARFAVAGECGPSEQRRRQLRSNLKLDEAATSVCTTLLTTKLSKTDSTYVIG